MRILLPATGFLASFTATWLFLSYCRWRALKRALRDRLEQAETEELRDLLRAVERELGIK
jgi:hypothetical protein